MICLSEMGFKTEDKSRRGIQIFQFLGQKDEEQAIAYWTGSEPGRLVDAGLSWSVDSGLSSDGVKAAVLCAFENLTLAWGKPCSVCWQDHSWSSGVDLDDAILLAAFWPLPLRACDQQVTKVHETSDSYRLEHAKHRNAISLAMAVSPGENKSFTVNAILRIY